MANVDYVPREVIDNEAAIRGADYALVLKINKTKIDGALVGGDTDKMIQIFQWENKISSPREASTGQATGRRVHYGIHLIGPISKASVPIFQGLIENQDVEGELKCYRLVKAKKVNFFSIKFTKGRIGEYQTLTSPTDGSLLYEFVIVYHDITHVWPDGGLEAMDSWQGQQ